MVRNVAISLVLALTIVSFLFCGCGREGSEETVSFDVGYSILLEADLHNISDANKAADMSQLIEVISTRCNLFSENNSTVQQQGYNRMLVELPGDVDIEVVKSLLTTKGFVEFREVERNTSSEPVCLNDYLSISVNEYFDTSDASPRYFVIQDIHEKDYRKPILIIAKDETGLLFVDIKANPIDKEELKTYGGLYSWMPSKGDDGTPLTGALLDDAYLKISPITDRLEINVRWNDQGTVIFDQIAARLYNPEITYTIENTLGIFLDRELLSAPQVRAQKFEGKCVISGEFTIAEAKKLVIMLKSEALPVPVTIVEIAER